MGKKFRRGARDKIRWDSAEIQCLPKGARAASVTGGAWRQSARGAYETAAFAETREAAFGEVEGAG